MRAMLFEEVGQPLALHDLPEPKPDRGQLLVRVNTCAVCRTDLHIVDGELPNAKLPLRLGHQIVVIVEQIGENVDGFSIGDRVGVSWLGWTVIECVYYTPNREKLG